MLIGGAMPQPLANYGVEKQRYQKSGMIRNCFSVILLR